MDCIIPGIPCWLSGLAGPGHFLNLTLRMLLGMLWHSFTICIKNSKDVLIFDITIILLEISLKEGNLGGAVT